MLAYWSIPPPPLVVVGPLNSFFRVMIDFSSNAGSASGSGFRIVAEELTTGCGGILHGMVTLIYSLYRNPVYKCTGLLFLLFGFMNWALSKKNFSFKKSKTQFLKIPTV